MRYLSFATLLLLLAAAPPAPAQNNEVPEFDSYFWGFFVTGSNREPADRAVLAEQQKAHIGNLERLFKEGKCPMAGPIGMGGRLRGIVIVKAATEAEARAGFENDPFVRDKRLALEFYPWKTPRGGIGKPVEPPSLQKAGLVILKKGPKWTGEDTPAAREAQRNHLAYLRSLYDAGELAIAGPFTGNNESLRGVCVYRTEDLEKVKELAGKDPHVLSGQLSVEAVQLYVGKGLLDRSK